MTMNWYSNTSDILVLQWTRSGLDVAHVSRCFVPLWTIFFFILYFFYDSNATQIEEQGQHVEGTRIGLLPI